MLEVSEKWQEASRAQFRNQAYLDLTLGITPPGLREGISATSDYSSVTPLSKVMNTVDGIVTNPSTYITLEQNWWKLDGSNTEAVESNSQTVGWWSEALMSSETGLVEMTVNIFPSGTGTVEGSRFYYKGDTARLEAKPVQGWDFVCWKENNEIISTNLVLTWTVSKSRTLLAQFEEYIGYDITVIIDPPGYGTVTGTGKHKLNSNVILTANPAAQCYFLWWEENGERYSTDATITFTATKDRQFIAVFGKDYYTISATVVPVNVGRVTGTGVYRERSDVTLTAITTNNDYYFDGWYENNERISFDTVLKFVPKSNRSFQAKWITYETLQEVVKSDFIGDLGFAGKETLGYDFNNKVYLFTNTANATSDWSIRSVDSSGTVSTHGSLSTTIRGVHGMISTNNHLMIISNNWVEEGAGGTRPNYIFAYNKSFTLTTLNVDDHQFGNGATISKINNTALIWGGKIRHYSAPGFTWYTKGLCSVNDSLTVNVLIEGNEDLYGTASRVNAAQGWNNRYAMFLYGEKGRNTYYGTDLFDSSYTHTEIGGLGIGYSTSVRIPSTDSYNDEVRAWDYNGALYDKYMSVIDLKGQINITDVGLTHLQDYILLFAPYGVYIWDKDRQYTGNLKLSISRNSYGVGNVGKYAIAAGGYSGSTYYSIIDFYELGDYIWATIAVQPNDATMGTTTGAGGYRGGEEVTLTAAPKTGYSFVGWECEGTMLSTSNPYKFEAAVSRNIIGVFEKTKWEVKVTYTPETAGVVEGAGKYENGETVTLKFITNTGYTFKGWVRNGTVVESNPYTFTITENMSFLVDIERTKCTVTATVSPEGFGEVPNTGVFDYGTNITLMPVYNSNSNAIFLGWYENNIIVHPSLIYSFVVTSDINLIAMFEVTCDVTTSTDPVGAGEVTGAGDYPYNSNVTVEFIPNEGQSFGGWSINGVAVSTENPYTFKITQNSVVVANSLGSYHNVTATVTPSGTGTVEGTGTFPYNSNVTVTLKPNTGYMFDHFELAGASISRNPYTFVLKRDTLIEAYTTVARYTVNLYTTPSGFATVSGGGTFDYNTQITIIAEAPSVDYNVEFQGWFSGTSKVSSSTSYTFRVTADVNLTAQFKLSCDLTGIVSPSGAGSISGLKTYDYKAIAKIEFTPSTGYSFKRWILDSNSITDNPYSFVIEKNLQVTAETDAKDYTVTTELAEPGSGTVYGEGTYKYGTQCTLRFSGAKDYAFYNWQNSDTGETFVENPYTFIVTGNVHFIVNAVEAASSFTVTTVVSPEGSGTATGGGVYAADQTAILRFTPNESYQFDRWTSDGQIFTENPYAFVVTSNRAFIAVAKPAKYIVQTIVSPPDAGTIEGAGEYEYNQAISLIFTPAEDTTFTFAYWLIDGQKYYGMQWAGIATKDIIATVICTSTEYHVSTNLYNIDKQKLDWVTFTGDGDYSEGSDATVTVSWNPPSWVDYVSNIGWRLLNADGTITNVNVVNTPSYTFKVTRDSVLWYYVSFRVKIDTDVGNAGGSIGANYLYSSPSGSSTTALHTGWYNLTDSYFTWEASPQTGYSVDHWEVNDVDQGHSNNSIALPVYGPQKIRVFFKPAKYTITCAVSPAGAGTVSGTGLYDYNTSCTLTFTPNPGYSFYRYTRYGSSSYYETVNPYTFKVTSAGNLTVYANKANYTPTLKLDNSSSGTVACTPASNIGYNDSVTIKFTPAANYEFIRWEDEAGNKITTNPYTYKATSEKTFTLYAKSTIKEAFKYNTYWNLPSGYSFNHQKTGIQLTNKVFAATYDSSGTTSIQYKNISDNSNIGFSATTNNIPGAYRSYGKFKSMAWFAGGINSSTVQNQVTSINDSLTATTKTALQTARCRSCMLTTSNYCNVIGGQTTSSSGYSNLVDTYNSSFTRTNGTAIPTAASNISALNVNNTIAIGFGGNASTSSSTAALSQVIVYNSSNTQTTTTLASGVRMVGYACIADTNNHAVFGGGSGACSDSSSSSYNRSNIEAFDTSGTRTSVGTLGRGSAASTGVTIHDDIAYIFSYSQYLSCDTVDLNTLTHTYLGYVSSPSLGLSSDWYSTYANIMAYSLSESVRCIASSKEFIYK